MKRIILYILLLFFAVNVCADNISAYTQKIMSQKRTLLKSSAEGDVAVPFYIHFSQPSVLDELADLGINTSLVVDNIAIAKMPVALASEIAAIEGVTYVEASEPVFTLMSDARSETFADDVLEGINLPSPYTGKGVVVGIVDIGIQLDHINFYDSEGNLRIKRFWNQNDTTGISPEGYDYGSEYKTQQAIETVKYDDDNGTHGIHVTGIATGGYKACQYHGVATEADIVFVSFGETDANILDAISYIYDYAKEVGKPAVVNLSMGSAIGPRDGTSSFDLIADELQESGCLLVGAAGNEGDVNSHASKTLTSAVYDSFKTCMSCGYDIKQDDYIEIYGSENTNFSVTLSLYNKLTGKTVSKSSTISTLFGNMVTFNLTEGIVGTIEAYSERMPSNNRPHVLIIKSLTQKSQDYAIELEVISTSGNTIHAWSYKDTFTNLNREDYTDGDSNYSVLEVGGTGKRIITVGAYTTKSHYGETVGDIASFSSKGPTSDGRMKPDVTAPGQEIVSSYSNSPNIANSSYYKPYLDLGTTVTIGDETYYYGTMWGTSMAAPVVTGIIATWLQARPTLTPEEAKEIIKSTSRTDTFTGDVTTTGNMWGYGKIDAWNGLKECLELNGIDNTESLIDDAVIYKNLAGVTELCFTTECKNVTISVADVSGKTVTNTYYNTVDCGEEILVDLSNHSSGIYVITVVAESFKKAIKVIK